MALWSKNGIVWYRVITLSPKIICEIPWITLWLSSIDSIKVISDYPLFFKLLRMWNTSTVFGGFFASIRKLIDDCQGKYYAPAIVVDQQRRYGAGQR